MCVCYKINHFCVIFFFCRLPDSCMQTHNVPTNHDAERHPDYEEDLAGAVGRVNT